MTKIKHVNLNIWEEEHFHKQAIEFLKNENPDILALQEVYKSEDKKLPEQYRFFDVIKKELNFDHFHFDAEFLDSRYGNPVPQGNVIFSRFPILEKKTVQLIGEYGEISMEGIKEKLPRNMVGAKLKIGETELWVYNAHGVWGERGDDTPDRIAMMNIIAKEIAEKNKVVVSRDFNLNERIFFHKMDNSLDMGQWRETQSVQILEKYLKNIFKNQRITSFNMKVKDPKTTTYGTAVVDMVFISPEIKVLRYSCPEVQVSDHLPTICEFEI